VAVRLKTYGLLTKKSWLVHSSRQQCQRYPPWATKIDFSIADLVADARAATPSAAAELISTDQNELLLHLDGLRDALGRSLQRQLKSLNEQRVSLRKRLRHPGHALSQQRKTLSKPFDQPAAR
jgi:hypothetical protein